MISGRILSEMIWLYRPFMSRWCFRRSAIAAVVGGFILTVVLGVTQVSQDTPDFERGFDGGFKQPSGRRFALRSRLATVKILRLVLFYHPKDLHKIIYITDQNTRILIHSHFTLRASHFTLHISRFTLH